MLPAITSGCSYGCGPGLGKGQSVTFDLDSYTLLAKALMGRNNKARSLIELPAVGEPDVLMP